MEKTFENIERAKIDYEIWKRYLTDMDNRDSMFIRKSFKDMFGYEIILFEEGGFELSGERY